MKKYTLFAAIVAVAAILSFGIGSVYAQTFGQGYIDGKTAGTQEQLNRNSTIKLLESGMTHPTHTDGFVDKNDPIVYNTSQDGGIVGVALASATAATDYIAVDLGGIWNLTIVATDDAGNSAVVIGDNIYINTTTGVLSKIRNANIARPFGLSLGAVSSGVTTVAAVLVSNDPVDYATAKVGTSAVRYTTAAANTLFQEYRYENSATSGDNRAIYNELALTGAGSGGESLRSRTIVEDVAGGTAHGAHLSLMFGDTGSITGLGVATRSTLHVPNAALTGGTYSGAMSEVWHDGASSDISGTTVHSLHRFSNSGNSSGQATMANVFEFTGLSATQFPTGTNTTIDHALQCKVNGTTYWIGLYDAKD